MKKLLVILVMVASAFGIYVISALTPLEMSYDFLAQSTTLIDSNLFTHKEDYEVYDQGDVDMTGFELILENDQIAVYMNPVGLTLRALNKTTGFIWASDCINISDYQLTGSWIRRIQSAVYIEYVDELNRSVQTPILHRYEDENPLTSYTNIDANTVLVTVDFISEEIAFAYEIKLVDSYFEISLDHDSIEEYGTNRITKITFLEFLGAVNEDDISGYFFLPSGNGALVRFTQDSPINNPFRARFYSEDKFQTSSAEDNYFDFPVFGAVHGVDQNGFLINITEGSEYAAYNYNPPTFQTDFHISSATFLLRESYIQTISSTENLLIFDTDIKNYSPTMRVNILSGSAANYVGMANNYQEYLVNTGKLAEAEASSNVDLHLDVVGREYEQGLLFKNYYDMTTVDDILTIDGELFAGGVPSVSYTYRGFSTSGYSSRKYDDYNFSSKLGDYHDLQSLNIDYYYDPALFYTNSISVPQDTMQLINYSSYQLSIMRGEYYEYHAKIDLIANELPDGIDQLQGYGGIAIDGISNLLTSSREITRDQIGQLYDGIFTEKVPMYRPNYIMIDNTSVYYLSMLYHDRSRFFTDSVPFVQIVFAGFLPQYSQFLNFSSNFTIDVLKIIDFGINPAFLITMEPSYLFSKTMSRDLYATYYDNLKSYMIDTYIKVDSALSSVMGQRIVEREIPLEGVSVVTYANGVKIYVNYRNSDVTIGDIEINALDFLVLE